MNEQKDYPRLQMNFDLKSVMVSITAEPEQRRHAFRLAHRLMNYGIIHDKTKAPLAAAFGYKNVETMVADVKAMDEIIMQVMRAFREDMVAGFGCEEDNEAPARAKTLTGADKITPY